MKPTVQRNGDRNAGCFVTTRREILQKYGRPGDLGSILGKCDFFFLQFAVARTAMGSTQPPTEWVPGRVSIWK